MVKIKLLSIIAIIAMFFAGCSKEPTGPVAGDGTHVGNALVSGQLFKGNGPAIGAKVFFVKVNYDPYSKTLGKTLAITDTVTTDSTGTYGTNDLDTGTYNVFGVGTDGNLSLEDSIHVTGDSQVVPPDTLKLPGSLAGIIKMQGTDDPRTVFVIPLGTNGFASTSITGGFSLTDMAEGPYSVRFLSILDRYLPLDTTFTITAAKDSILPDSIVLPLKIPTPTGFKAAYDTLTQVVTLSWDKGDSSRVRGYNVYRQQVDSAEVKVNPQPLLSPLYVDSTGVQDQTYIYSVVAVDFENNPGIRTAGDSVKIVSAFQFLMAMGSAGTSDGQFNEPGEMAVDSLGNIYVLDPFNTQGKIHKFSSAGLFVKTWVAGAFDELRDIEITRDTLYVLDRKNKRIKLFNTAGDSLHTWAFTASANPMSFTLQNNCAFILDKQNNQILKYTLGGDSLTAWSGMGSNKFKALVSISNSNNGLFYLLDSDSLGYVADSLGNLVSQFKVDRNAVVAAYSQWFLLNSGNLIYTGIENNMIFVIDIAGHLLAKFGESGTGNGQFKYPNSVIEYANKIFISDAQNSRIQVFNE
ncbi:MAG: hypothetical protein V1913_13775 [Fibrobacterota bacterium]